jgi:hypothetical protein
MDDTNTLTPFNDGEFIPSPGSVTAGRISSQSVGPAPGVQDSKLEDLEQPAWYQTAAATWRRETVLGQVMTNAGIRPDIGAEADAERGWNPYSFYKRNEAEFTDIQPYLLQGQFDHIHSEAQFKTLTESLRKSVRDLETMEKGGLAGTISGMGASLLDVTSLIPLGQAKWFKTGSRLLNSSRAAGAVALQAGTQELALAQFDRARTADEAWMNIGIGAALGAGIGSLSKVSAHPASALNPANQIASGKTINSPVDEFHVGRVGQTEAEGAVKWTTGNAGAAKVTHADTEIAKPDGVVAGFLNGVIQKTFMHWTPATRVWAYQPKARETLLKLSDVGSVMTQAIADGKGAILSAEDYHGIIRQRHTDYQDDLKRVYAEANMDLGASKIEVAGNNQLNTVSLDAVDRNRVPKKVFFDALYKRRLVDEFTDAGDSDAMVNYTKWLESELNSRGYSPEQIQAISSRVESASQRTQEHLDSFKKEAINSGLMAPEDFRGSYAWPQIFDRHAINADPKGFERIMLDYLAQNPSTEFLVERGLDLQKFKALPDRQRAETLMEWRGEFEQAQAQTAASAFESAARKLDLVKEDFYAAAKEGETARADVKKATVSAMRAEVRASEANYFAKRLATQKRKVMAAESRLSDLKKSYPDLAAFADDVTESFSRAGGLVDKTGQAVQASRAAVTEADSLIAFTKGQAPATPPAAPTIENLRREAAFRSELDAAYKERAVARDGFAKSLDEFQTAAQESRYTNRWLDAVTKKAKEFEADETLAREGVGIETALSRELERLDVLKARAAEAETLRKELSVHAQTLRSNSAVTRRELAAASRDYTSTRKFKARMDKSQPLYAYLESLSKALRGGERFPHGMLLDTETTSGRMLERKFNFPQAIHERMVSDGFLNADPVSLLDRYQADMGHKISIKKALGDETLEQAVKGVRDEYDTLIDKHRAAGNLKNAEALTKMRDKAIDDVRTVWSRADGTNRMGGQIEGPLGYMAEKVREVGFIGSAGGFVLSAASDLATAMLSTSGFLKNIPKHARSYSKLIAKAEQSDEGARQLKVILAAMETGPQFGTSSSSYGGRAARDELGYGTGSTRRITAKVDQAMRVAGDRVSQWSGLQAVSNTMRRTAAFVQIDNIRTGVADWAQLSKARKAELAGIGIGEGEAARLKALFTKYGESDGPLFDPGLRKWLDEPDGDHMTDIFNIALLRTQRRASYLGGYATVPKLMDNQVGALFLQFQSYAFAFTNNFLLGGMQRLSTVGDQRFLGAVGMSMVMAGFTSQLRAQMRGDDTSQWDRSKWTSEILTRSGLLGVTQAYFDAGSKLVGNTINETLGFNLLTPSTKYARNSWVDSLLGPWYGVIKTAGESAAHAGQLEFTEAGQKAYRFVPLRQQYELGQAFVNTITE